MDTMLMFFVIVLLKGSLCFYMPNVDRDAKLDRPREISDFLQNRKIQRGFNARLNDTFDTSNDNDSEKYQENRTPSLEYTAIHTTITASNHQPTGDVTLTVATIPTVKIWWVYTDSTTRESVYTIGEFTTDDQSISSSIVYSQNMASLCFNLAAEDYWARFSINSKAVVTERTDTLSSVSGLIEFPLNVSFEDNTLDFDYKQTNSTYPNPNPALRIYYVPFGGNRTPPLMDYFRNEIVETNTRGTFHVSCVFKNIKEDGQVWISFNSLFNRIDNEEGLAKYDLLRKMIPIHLENPQPKVDALSLPLTIFYPSPNKVYLESSFRYGSLYCYAHGIPTPLVDFYKDGVLQYSIKISYFGSVHTAILPFDGRSLQEVTGNYVCNATSESKSLTMEYLVKKFENN